jgi:hypothetical protein
MSTVRPARLLGVFGHDTERFAERVASDTKLAAAERLADAQIENERLRKLSRRPELPIDVSVAPEEQRARSRANLDRPAPGPNWSTTIPKRPDPMSTPKPMQRLDSMTPEQQQFLKDLM